MLMAWYNGVGLQARNSEGKQKQQTKQIETLPVESDQMQAAHDHAMLLCESPKKMLEQRKSFQMMSEKYVDCAWQSGGQVFLLTQCCTNIITTFGNPIPV